MRISSWYCNLCGEVKEDLIFDLSQKWMRELGVDDNVFCESVSDTIHDLCKKEMKYNKLWAIRKIIDSCAKNYESLKIPFYRGIYGEIR